MTPDERQFLLTAAWLFLRHGQTPRARTVCEALHEDDPRDGTASAALAELLLRDGDPARALDALQDADVPARLAPAAAVLETRALRNLGRKTEADARWHRYLESRKGAARQWMA